MSVDYRTIRNAYYLGILLLVIYALPAVSLIERFLVPIFEYQLIKGLPIISIVALLVGIGAFAAYKYRKIG